MDLPDDKSFPSLSEINEEFLRIRKLEREHGREYSGGDPKYDIGVLAYGCESITLLTPRSSTFTKNKFLGCLRRGKRVRPASLRVGLIYLYFKIDSRNRRYSFLLFRLLITRNTILCLYRSCRLFRYNLYQ